MGIRQTKGIVKNKILAEGITRAIGPEHIICPIILAIIMSASMVYQLDLESQTFIIKGYVMKDYLFRQCHSLRHKEPVPQYFLHRACLSFLRGCLQRFWRLDVLPELFLLRSFLYK